MSAHWRDGETALRRKLLFCLLKGFDFDNPVLRYEPLSEPLSEMSLAAETDTFIFTFQGGAQSALL